MAAGRAAAYEQRVHPVNDLHTRVNVTLQARGLANRDLLSTSDPFAVVLVGEPGVKDFEEIGRTETARDSLSPDWETWIELIYMFEVNQTLRIVVKDDDGDGDEQLLGECEVPVAWVASQPETTHRLDTQGEVTVICELQAGESDEATMVVSASELARRGGGCFGKSDPFLMVKKKTETGKAVTAHKTEWVRGTSACTWAPMVLPMKRLCDGNKDRPVLFEVYSYAADDGHRRIGSAEATINDIESHRVGILELHDEDSTRVRGRLRMDTLRIESTIGFLEYVRGGIELSLVVAIDFTASNKDPREPGTLHYNEPGNPSPYATAIQSVCEVVAQYDADQMFPVYGFGANVDGVLSHCFPCNGQTDSPEVEGVSGILDAYTSIVNTIQFAGPTNFAPVIDATAKRAAETGTSKYYVLLILTDGLISDLPDTLKLLSRVSGQALSIVIIGVGTGPFKGMEALDGDDPTSRGKRNTVRDIVQFVEFTKFAHGPPAALAEETLREIPRQFMEWAKHNRITLPER